MTSPQWDQFRGELADATVRNLSELRRVLPALLEGRASTTPPQAAELVAAWLLAVAPYRFNPTARVAPVVLCRRRRYSACADVAAAAAAAAILMGARSIDTCVEERADVPGYAHVRLTIDGVGVNPYAFAALPAVGCTQGWSLVDDVTRARRF